MNCRQVRPLLETFADGELTPGEIIDVETHLDECEACAAQLAFSQSVQASVRRAVHEDADVSPEFSARLEAALLAEEQRTAAAQPEQSQTRRWFSRRNLGPSLAAAAVMVAWLGWQRFGAVEGARTDGPRHPVVEASAASDIQETLDRLIDYHSAPQEPQVREAKFLPTFEPNIGVRIHLPALSGAHWEGASLVPVVNHQAASLLYSMPGHRVTVYVFDPRKVPVRQPLERMARRVDADESAADGDDSVYVGQWRGYSVAAKERRGVGYAMTADLDDQEILRLISSIQ